MRPRAAPEGQISTQLSDLQSSFPSANMTGREPANIRKLLRDNEQYAAAHRYAQDVQRGDAVSSWHEQQSRKSSRPEQMPQGNLQDVDLKIVSYSPQGRMQRK